MKNKQIINKYLPITIIYLIFLLSKIFEVKPILAQSIQSANDQTNTQINQQGNQFDINGGILSGDGQNLFHSFQQFNLNSNEIANFLSNPNIQNILGRVTGGNASLLDGLIKITGGNSNLYLMNPAGIIFGNNFTLNIPADFTATTATGIGFNNNWFNAFGDNNYQDLIGNPNQFAFDLTPNGAIVNSGNLTVNQGNNLNLISGTVINTGTITAPQGNINIISVEGTNTIRISQEGSLLSLEIEAPRHLNNIIEFSPLDLPELLTGSGLNTGLTVENNQISLTQTGQIIPVNDGTTIINNNLDVSGNSGGNINLLGERVGLFDANLNANGLNNGGTILIGGDQQGLGNIPNAQQVFINHNSLVQANAIESGNGGKIIVFAEDTAQIDGQLQARGGSLSGDGGLIETSGLKGFMITQTPDISALNGNGGEWLIDPFDITIVAGNGNSNINNTNPFISSNVSAQLGIDLIKTALLSGDVTISTGAGGTETGNITLNTDLDFNNIGTGKTLTLNAHNAITINGKIFDSITGSDSLNLILNGNTDNSATGQTVTINNNIDTGGGSLTVIGTGSNTNRGIWIKPNVSINTQGGDISLTATEGYPGIYTEANTTINSGGGNITINGTSSEADGVRLDGAIVSVGGNINITGKATLNNGHGVVLFGTLDSENGNITIDGSTNTTFSNFYGVLISDQINSNSNISSGAGNINITGVGSNNARVKVGSQLISSTGNITIAGSTPNTLLEGILIEKPINAGNGNIAIIADRNQILNSIQGAGNLTIAPQSNNIPLEIGTNNPSNTIGIFLEASELTKLVDGFNSITIGSNTFANTITLNNNINFNDNVVIQANGSGGSINTLNSNIFTNANSLTLETNQNINTANITTNGGRIIMTSTAGSINTSNGTLNTSSNSTGGAISLTTNNGNIITNGLNSSSNSSGNGGNINLIINGSTGNISAGIGGIISTANSGNGGNINLTTNGGNITTNTLNSSNFGFNGTAGNINLKINGGTGIINASASNIQATSLGGIGGNVSLIANNNILVNTIKTESIATGVTTGNGGNVTISTPQMVRILGTFNAADGSLASISTIGKVTGGNVSITHGGNGIIPFIVGDPTINGSAGKITTGTSLINPVQSFLNTTIIGNIAIISVDPVIPPVTPPVTPPITPPITPPVTPPITPPITPPTTSPTTPPNSPLPNLPILNSCSILTTSNCIEYHQILPPELSSFETKILDQNRENPLIHLPAEALGEDFTNYFNLPSTPIKTLNQTQNELKKIEEKTGIKPALLYIFFKSKSEELTPTNNENNHDIFWQFNNSSQEQFITRNNNPEPTDEIELILVTSSGDIVKKRVEGATREMVMPLVENYRSLVTNIRRGNLYLESSQALYQILIKPIESDLENRAINNISLIMDSGLRTIPMAALNDGEKFLVEKYSLGLMPSFSLTNTQYNDIRQTSVLGMGADTFTEQNPLPAVPIELSVITNKIWQGEEYLNQDFTINNYQKIRQNNKNFGILHLATHGEFQPGQITNSYIQFWDQKLSLDQLSTLKLNNPQVELLVLSACRTALGDNNAELGFAGLAIAAGVKSALGSLWYVSDQGTLALMTEFYEKLKNSPIKTEALRQTQINMIKGKVRYENGQLITDFANIPLPENLELNNSIELSHPYYWSAFTMIGNPW